MQVPKKVFIGKVSIARIDISIHIYCKPALVRARKSIVTALLKPRKEKPKNTLDTG